MEVIIVDDASTDCSEEVVSEFQGRDKRPIINYIRLNKNRGAPSARNAGLHSATGEYVIFVDSDDVIISTGIENLLEILDCRSLDYVYGRVKRADADLIPLVDCADVGAPFRLDGNGAFDLSWHTMGAIYSRDYINKKVGDWNESLTGSQDWEFQARVKMGGGKCEFVDTVVGYWRRHEGPRIGTSGFNSGYVESVLKACLSIEAIAKNKDFFDFLLRRRLCRRLINHMLEACVNKDIELTVKLGGEAKRLCSQWSFERFVCWIVVSTKSSLVSMPLFKLIRSI